MNVNNDIAMLRQVINPEFLSDIQRGLEKENLRVHFSGKLSQKDHPLSLGKALTNPYITTDFSEALPELITPPIKGYDALFQHLLTTCRFVGDQLLDEYLWPLSMPPQIDDELEIRIAEYGQSDVARMKHVYRVGLWHRYGRIIQAIAGIHYNFSLPDEFFKALQHAWKNDDDFYDFRSKAYMKALRAFHCHAWLLPYLFGASPACFNTSVFSEKEYLRELDKESQYAPWGTSLRMSDLGYQNNSQAGLNIRYSSVKDYAADLLAATRLSNPEFEKLGIKHGEHYQQLNANVLQIENEFYSFIRPKPKALSGERPAISLCKRGVEYVEVRLLDLNPLIPLGVDPETLAFLDVFLVFFLVTDCQRISQQSCEMARDNFQKVATQGRAPHLKLLMREGSESFVSLSQRLLESMMPLAQWMDEAKMDGYYQAVVQAQMAKIDDASLTPSAQMLAKINDEKMTYRDFCFLQAEKEFGYIMRADYDQAIYRKLQDSVTDSIQQWQQKEKESRDFEGFLRQYFGE